MAEMTTRERFKRMYEHREADRVPMLGGPWGTTIERWQREGMPKDASFADYFGLDHVVGVGGDTSPRYPYKVVEETDEYIIAFDSWGTTSKNWKHASSTPHWIARTIVDRDSWEAAKARMVMGRDRINWDYLKANYRTWRENGCWMQGSLWFGFDVTHARIVGTERLLMMMADDPQLVIDMFNYQLDCSLELLQMIWDEGYTFDAITWCDDMGYRNGPFFSIDMYRRILKPAQKRAIEWAHEKGIVAHLHSCGNINKLLPELTDIGLDALNPLEVKAGMDPVHIKKTYGDRLVLHGGLNAMLWDDIDKIEAEIRRLMPILKQNGGYIFAEDHSIPDSVSLENYRRIVALGKQLGSYE
ncbi:MAG TPA: uroporphyrinogen decarboxylase family protein [Phycisphaerae bacterium]|nr:uroporphyrinogen decarboxylase family protein [Phycisphaerae bacterium]